MKIGIDLNGVIRDLNKQCVKYYVKDIDPTFDEETLDMDKMDVLQDLPFPNKSDRTKFAYEDYPFEIYGCAPSMSRNLHTFLNGWAYSKYWDDNIDVGVFALNEDELTIQSTFHYLSKSGTRLRRVIFPINEEDVFNEFDVIITANKKLVKKCPKGKVVVLIKKSDNQDCNPLFTYNTLENIFQDKTFILKLENTEPQLKVNIFHKFFNKIKSWWKNM